MVWNQHMHRRLVFDFFLSEGMDNGNGGEVTAVWVRLTVVDAATKDVSPLLHCCGLRSA